jgi:peptidoglycan/xylan/chitin deacetylase (PgdA/CDA1 family)
MLSIVMYHYVRELSGSAYPRIKARTITEFEHQLDYIDQHHNVCSLEDVVAASRGGRPLPAHACLLTFDDGFIDHLREVAPRLHRRGWSGAFFPPARSAQERRVLDVHKIHFVLASTDDAVGLADRVLTSALEHGSAEDLGSADTLRAEFGAPTRFDCGDVALVKRLLQHGLPLAVRTAVVKDMFRTYVTADESAFADDLYMSLEQLRTLLDMGMAVGGHGDAHVWLGRSSASEQNREIERTIEFLGCVHGSLPEGWAMCYPYGSYDATMLTLLRGSDCAIGLTTTVAVAQNLSRPLELPRLDTNDLPISAVVV